MENIKYTREMYQHLAWRLFQEMYDDIEWCREEKASIARFTDEAGRKLTDGEIKVVENRVRRMNNEYEAQVMETLKDQYWQEFDHGEDDFFFAPVEYNEQFYEIWKQGVARRRTVKMKYDSTGSGITERLVDPYKSSAPYVEGYCHNRKEVRKFRFDRVIDIELTDNKFEKPKEGK